jgi:hypothetical protein
MGREYVNKIRKVKGNKKRKFGKRTIVVLGGWGV